MLRHQLAGHKNVVNDAAPIIGAYFDRKRLAELGYTSPLSDLSDFEAKCFLLISQEIDKFHSEEMKRKGK
jgi:hypothetical protein